MEDGEFAGVAAEGSHAEAMEAQDLGNEETEFAVAQDGDGGAAWEAHLFEDFAGGGNGLSEDGVFVGDVFGDGQEVFRGKSQVGGKSAGVAHDAEDGAAGAMAAEMALAPRALAAGEIDFADDAAALHFADKFVAGDAGKAVVAAEEFEVRIADAGEADADAHVALAGTRQRGFDYLDNTVFEPDSLHRFYNEESSMRSYLACFEATCGAEYPVTEVIYNCPRCGGLLEVRYSEIPSEPWTLKQVWRERRMSNHPLDQSGVWRYREMFPFLEDDRHVMTLREGNTPLLDGCLASSYAGVDRIRFKHQGFNPTGSFKDNGMTAGASQAVRLGMKRVACVSTGNTSASMAAYAAMAGLDPIILIPNGNIAFGKLGQALDYGARTLQVEANFDQILALVRVLAEKLGIYLLNSVNPFRIEGQKSIVIEMMDQLDWEVPDWIVVPGGNLGNISAFGKGVQEMHRLGLITKLPRFAVIQAAGASPFYEFMKAPHAGGFVPNTHPETLATAIKIGDPVSWPKAWQTVGTEGVVESVTEAEIADAKAVIGRCGIGCEPASAATLAGIKKLRAAGKLKADEIIVAVLTGNVLKDPDYIYRYHTNQLQDPHGEPIRGGYANPPVVVPNDVDAIAKLLEA